MHRAAMGCKGQCSLIGEAWCEWGDNVVVGSAREVRE
jgi:hypothetical protein